MEVAKTFIACSNCGAVVRLMTRLRHSRFEGEPSVPFYITHDGQHVIENVHEMGREYPVVDIVECRVRLWPREQA